MCYQTATEEMVTDANRNNTSPSARRGFLCSQSRVRVYYLLLVFLQVIQQARKLVYISCGIDIASKRI